MWLSGYAGFAGVTLTFFTVDGMGYVLDLC